MSEHRRLRDRDDELRAPVAGVGHLLEDLVLEVPRQDEDVVGLGLVDALGRWIGMCVPGRNRPCLYGLRSTVKSMKSVRMPQ